MAGGAGTGGNPVDAQNDVSSDGGPVDAQSEVAPDGGDGSAGACNTVVNTAPVVEALNVAENPPTLNGGTLVRTIC